MCPDYYKQSLNAIYHKLSDYITRVLLISGYPKERKEATQMVLELIQTETKHLWKLIEKISVKIKEHASSADHELFTVPPSMEFDEKTMHNQGTVRVRKTKTPQMNQKVLCTVELGVKSIRNDTKPGEQSSGKPEDMVMTKAVVVFESEAEFL